MKDLLIEYIKRLEVESFDEFINIACPFCKASRNNCQNCKEKFSDIWNICKLIKNFSFELASYKIEIDSSEIIYSLRKFFIKEINNSLADYTNFSDLE